MQLTNLQNRLAKVKVVIIDEYSMVGCKMLNIIDSRLRIAKCRLADLFGNVDVYMLGDPKQLPPVADTPVTNANTQSKSKQVKDGQIAFSMFENVVELVTNNRVSDPAQQPLRTGLANLRIGKFTKAGKAATAKG